MSREDFDSYIGRKIKGKYQVLKFIGRGSMGKVYKCRNIHLNNEWAIKIVSKDYEYSNYFRKEAEILEKINHPNIPRIVDLFEDSENIYIVESYIEGKLLQEKIAEEGKIELQEAFDYFKQLAQIIGYLHDLKPYPIIYRDLKPNNVIITHGNRLVLVDFSISKVKDNNDLNTIVAGNKYYSSPEQLRFDEKSDNRSDIYSLGMLIVRMITGNMNRQVDSALIDSMDISSDFRMILDRCIDSDKESRYQSIKELMDDILVSQVTKPKTIFKSKDVILVDGGKNLGKTFVSSHLAKFYAKNMVRCALVDLSEDVGVLEYIDVKIDENITECIYETDINKIKKASYKPYSNLDVYKGEIVDVDAFLTFIRRLEKAYDVVIIDNTDKIDDMIKIHDIAQDIIIVTSQDEKAESATNKKLVYYVDNSCDLKPISVVVNKFDEKASTLNQMLSFMNILPKIFKEKSRFQKVYSLPEIDRTEFLQLSKEKKLDISKYNDLYLAVENLAKNLYPLDVIKSSKEKKEIKSLSKINLFASVKSRYKTIKNNFRQSINSTFSMHGDVKNNNTTRCLTDRTIQSKKAIGG